MRCGSTQSIGELLAIKPAVVRLGDRDQILHARQHRDVLAGMAVPFLGPGHHVGIWGAAELVPESLGQRLVVGGADDPDPCRHGEFETMLLVGNPSSLVHRGLGVGDSAVEVEDDSGRRVHDAGLRPQRCRVNRVLVRRSGWRAGRR